MRLVDPDQALPFVAAPDRRAVLHALLDEALQRFAPEFAPRLANHVPMALAALDGLGASPAQMRRFLDREAAEQAPAPAAADAAAVDAVESSGDWTRLRGDLAAWPVLRTVFSRRLAREGREACLQAVVPLLMPGLGGVAFHGAIRSAHAIDAGHEGELAAALAYWAARWEQLPAPATNAAAALDFATPAEWLDALDARLLAHERDWRPRGRYVNERMREAPATQAYAALAGAVHGFRGDLDAQLLSLARAAAGRYALTRNFTVLHMATTARALRVLTPWLDAAEPVPASAWHAVAAASLSSGATWVEPVAPRRDERDWPALRQRACDSDNDHVIKLVHAMSQQHAHAPSPVWLTAARVALPA